MKVISFIFLIYCINLIFGFLKFPEKMRPYKKIVKNEIISSSQEYDDTKVKLIETNFDMLYTNYFNAQFSNSPVAPRTDGGYYIAFTDKNYYLHVLSYDKNDKLLKDFNIMEKALPVDITATEDGFAIYVLGVNNDDQSYLSLYNNSFQLVKTVQIMNNSKDDDKTVDSTLEKQVIGYDENKTPLDGMRFMYNPCNGKLIYSGGRIFLIFGHYNYFLDEGGRGHSGDSTVSFDNSLNDMDFGDSWGASHSLIQSATADENYFWTAALSDGYPNGIKVTYTSKTEFSTVFDPINNKKNQRKFNENDKLAGKIIGYKNGYAEGKLGGILYFEKYKIYCLVYAKTSSLNEDNTVTGTNINYITTWQFENNKIVNNKTMIVNEFSSEYVMQIRAGKFGDDKVFITYSDMPDDQIYKRLFGDIPKGTTPYFYLIDITNHKKLKSGVKLDKLLMNTNEDLRTFEDGVLIWATSNKDGKLSIIKIGTVSY